MDANNQVVLGTGEVNPTTQVYTVKFNGKLPDGIYTVRVRAEDSGYVSPPSPKFTFEVVTPPGRRNDPGMPASLRRVRLDSPGEGPHNGPSLARPSWSRRAP